jgi:hypothetical protein
MVSPGGWLVSSVLFCLPAWLKLWREVGLPDHAGWSEPLISPADFCVFLQLQLFSQLLSQWGGAVQFCIWPPGSGDQLCDPLPSLIWRWLLAIFVYWDFWAGNLFLWLAPFLWGGLCSTHPFLCLCFIIVHFWFSVLQCSSVLDAALWLRRSALWCATCPALGSGLSAAHSQSSVPLLCLFTFAQISSLPLPLSPLQFQHSITSSHCSCLIIVPVCYSVLLRGSFWPEAVLV